MKMSIKTPGLGAIMRIHVGVGFTTGALALTESQAHAKSLFAVIADAKTNTSFCCSMKHFTFCILHCHLLSSISSLNHNIILLNQWQKFMTLFCTPSCHSSPQPQITAKKSWKSSQIPYKTKYWRVVRLGDWRFLDKCQRAGSLAQEHFLVAD